MSELSSVLEGREDKSQSEISDNSSQEIKTKERHILQEQTAGMEYTLKQRQWHPGAGG
jgi:hypothetical protein